MSIEKNRDNALRERVNFVLSSQVIERLREKSTQNGIPMSRIVDSAVTAYLEPAKPVMVGSAEDGITLDHSLEFRLLIPYDTPQTNALIQDILKFFPHSAVATCFYGASEGRSPVTGKKIETYFTMDQIDAFTECLATIGSNPNKVNIQLFRDHQLINL